MNVGLGSSRYIKRTRSLPIKSQLYGLPAEPEPHLAGDNTLSLYTWIFAHGRTDNALGIRPDRWSAGLLIVETQWPSRERGKQELSGSFIITVCIKSLRRG